ncbi:DUF4174 domain-containing protein [Enterovibrio nigricans]|uniref:DUF4174 domain-containing protein n=1 Tax=Enterovibrio nigricans DSM 22720 TaxID=1121868 RepID=A0A1T4W4X9_9GAMM|nr:DUF4174 domain-containing protein [Enterovibrio nigricans]SKA72199.1 protein of unknown function [Enterovibrio nigricans DSM 22720]
MQRLLRISVLLLLSLPVASYSYPYYAVSHPHRTLMYFTPSEDDNSKAFEQQMLMHDCQMNERNLHSLVLDMGSMTDSKGIFSSQDITRLVERFRITTKEHVAVLIGKDGTEKFRWQSKVNINELVNVIDDMPMRQGEKAKSGIRCSI